MTPPTPNIKEMVVCGDGGDPPVGNVKGGN